MNFEWDSEKAELNLSKHGVTFEEASTAFGDPLSITISDPDHSDEEDRFILLGQTYSGRFVVVVHTERDETIRLISARIAQRGSEGIMKKDSDSSQQMRDEYDFSKGVRGKYAQRFAKGSNVVVLDPDVASRFKTSAAVNDALRAKLAEQDGKAASGS